MPASGRQVRVIQRSRPKDLPVGAEFVAADVMNEAAIIAATAGAEANRVCPGSPVFRGPMGEGLAVGDAEHLAACEAHGARLVFADNLYLYGPLNRVLTKDLPAVDYGRKPKARAEVTRLWQAVHHADRVQAVAVRSPD